MENGLIGNEVDDKANKEIMRSFSKSDIGKVIYCESSKEIWDKL